MKTLISCSILSLAMGVSPAFSAQVIKSTMPDGKVVYGEKPAPGAAKVETIETPTGKTGVSSALTQEEKARAEALARQREQADNKAAAKSQGVAQAREALKQAEAAKKAGEEPLAGERQGLAGGGSRLSEAYFARQKSLDDAVTTARKRLADAEAGR